MEAAEVTPEAEEPLGRHGLLGVELWRMSATPPFHPSGPSAL